MCPIVWRYDYPNMGENPLRCRNRVPTVREKPGKQGKWQKKIPCREKSGNLKISENIREKSGNLKISENIREKSGNFIGQIIPNC